MQNTNSTSSGSLKPAADKIGSQASQLKDKAAEQLSGVKDSIKNQVTQAKDQFSHLATDVTDQVKDWIPEEMNISDVERYASGIFGTALAAVAVSRFLKSDFWFGGLALAGGAAFLTRGLTGKCPMSKALKLETRSQDSQDASPSSRKDAGATQSQTPNFTHA